MSASATTVPSQRKPRVKYVRLGNSGLKVSNIILGCMSYGSSKWRPWTLDEDEGIKHIKYAYDQGIQTFDTANMYSNGMSEVVLGKAIKEHNIPREEIVVMTKVRHPVGKTLDTNELALFLSGPDNCGYVNQHGLSRKHIFDSVKASLERLQMDYIDVLQCHRFDYDTPVEETMQALHDIVKAGFVRYIGMSSCHAWQFHVMQNYAITHNLTPFISMQNHYNLLYREEEREMMPTLKHFGVGSIPWSPLGRGALTRPPTAPTPEVVKRLQWLASYSGNPKATAKSTSSLGPKPESDDADTNIDNTQVPAQRSTRQDSDEIPAEAYFLLGGGSTEIVQRVGEVARKMNVSMAQVALAWLLAKDGVTAPIVGTTSLAKLDDLLGANDIEIGKDDMTYLEEAYKPMKTFTHN